MGTSRLGKLTLRGSTAWILGAVAVAVARPGGLLWLGAAVAALGLGLRVWATGYLSKNQRLTREGPYRFVRHPLYLGTWLIATGVLVGCLDWPPAAERLLLLIGFQVGFFGYYLPRKERKEAGRLERLFGDEFVEFRAAVPAFVPRVVPAPVPEPRWKWSLAHVAGNSEWGTQIATLLVFGFLAFRAGVVAS